MQVYYAQQLHWQQHSKYSNDLQELGVSVLKIEGLVGLWVEKTRVGCVGEAMYSVVVLGGVVGVDTWVVGWC